MRRTVLFAAPALALAAAAWRGTRPSPLDGRVVVITGASSGLGRAVALAFAARHCRVVLAARRAGLLDELAAECRARGGEALAVRTDVTVEDDVVALRDRAVAQWGRIDVWVNNAGVTMYSRIDEATMREHRRVIETNLFGSWYAARAVVPLFRRQRAGILINVASILGKVGHAMVPSYVISKHALHGLSETLRVELADEPDIHVCTILPYAIDTPHFESGGNVIGRKPHALPPVQMPEDVARAMVALAARPRRQVHVPRYTALGLMLHAVFPRPAEQLLRRALWRFHLGGDQPATEGGLFAPSPGPGTVHGNRQPLVSTTRFVLWAMWELGKILAADARSGRRLEAQSAAPPGSLAGVSPVSRERRVASS